MKKLIVTIVLLCISSLALMYEQQKTQKEQFKATYNASKALVKSQQFSFVGEVVYNNKHRELLDAESNTLKIDKSDISGKIISLSTANKSFDLNGKLEDFKVTYDDEKQHISISFKVDNSNEKLDVFIDIKANGKAFLTVASGNHSNISWTGHLK